MPLVNSISQQADQIIETYPMSGGQWSFCRLNQGRYSISERESFGLLPLFFIIETKGNLGDHILFGWPLVLCDVFLGMSSVVSDRRPHEN